MYGRSNVGCVRCCVWLVGGRSGSHGAMGPDRMSRRGLHENDLTAAGAHSLTPWDRGDVDSKTAASQVAVVETQAPCRPIATPSPTDKPHGRQEPAQSEELAQGQPAPPRVRVRLPRRRARCATPSPPPSQRSDVFEVRAAPIIGRSRRPQGCSGSPRAAPPANVRAEDFAGRVGDPSTNHWGLDAQVGARRGARAPPSVASLSMALATKCA